MARGTFPCSVSQSPHEKVMFHLCNKRGLGRERDPLYFEGFAIAGRKMLFPPKQLFEGHTFDSVPHPSEGRSCDEAICETEKGARESLFPTPRPDLAARGNHVVACWAARWGAPSHTHPGPTRCHSPWMVLLKKALQASQEATP